MKPAPEIIEYIISIAKKICEKDFFISNIDLEDSSTIKIYSSKLSFYKDDKSMLNMYLFELDGCFSIFIKSGEDMFFTISNLDNYSFKNNGKDCNIIDQAKFLTILQNYLNFGYTWYPSSLPEDGLKIIEQFLLGE